MISPEVDISASNVGKSFYWKLEGNDLNPLEGEPQDGTVNYFTLSADGKLSYTSAAGAGAIDLGDDILFLKINMNDYPTTFSIDKELQADVYSCYIYVKNGTKLTGPGDLGDKCNIYSELIQNESFTVDNTTFVAAASGELNLKMVGEEDATAKIFSGSVFLSKANGHNEYSGSNGGSVIYDYTGNEQNETAVAIFANGTLQSIKGLDKVGETVTVIQGGAEVHYEKTAFGLKSTQGDVSYFYTGEVGADTNVLKDITDWSDVQPLAFSLTLGSKYYEVTAAAGALTGYNAPPESGNYFQVDDNGTINYVSKDIALNGKVKVTMEVDASGFTGDALNLYRGEGDATFKYNVTNLKAKTVTNVYYNDIFATAASGVFSFTRAGENEQPVIFNVTTDEAAFWVDDSTVAIKKGSVVLSTADGQNTYSGAAGGSVTYEYTGDVQDESVVATFTNGETTSVTGLDKVGEKVTVIFSDYAGVTYEVTESFGLIRTIDGKSSSYTGGEVDAKTNVLELTDDNDWTTVDTRTALTDPEFSLTLGETYYEVTMKAGQLEGSNTEPKSGDYFKVENGTISYASNKIKLSGKVTMEVNASGLEAGELKLYRGEDGATFTYKVTALKNGAAFTNISSGDTFAAAAGSYSFTMAGGDKVQSYSVTADSDFVADESTVAMYSGTATLDSDYSELVASGEDKTDKSDNVTVELTVAGDSEAIEGSVKVAVTNGAVSSITGIDVIGEIVKVTNDKGETTYGLDTIGGNICIYRSDVNGVRAYYTGTETNLSNVDVIDAKDPKDWTACTDEVILTKPTIAITPGSEATSYYIVEATASETGSEVTASKQTDKPTKAQNYFTVTNTDDIYRLTYTPSALNPITLSGTVTVNLNGTNMSHGILELYKPGGDATFTYNVTNLKIDTVHNVTKGDTFETSEEGHRFMFEIAGDRPGVIDFDVTTTATFCADDSTVAVKNGTVNVSRGDEFYASGSDATSATDNVKVAVTIDDDDSYDGDYSVKVKVENGEVKSITGLDNGEIVTYNENTTYKVVGNTIIKTEKKMVEGKETTTIEKLTTGEATTGEVNLLSDSNKWVSNQTTMGEVSFDFKLTGAEEQYWILSGNNTLTVATAEQTGADTNFFKLSSDGELTYTSAQNPEADIINLDKDKSQVTLKVDMSTGGEAPKFSVNGALEDCLTACEITGKNGATVTGFADRYTFTAEGLAENDFVTINEQKFTMAAGDGALKLSGVKTANDDSKALITTGSIKLGVEGEESTNEYYSFDGSQVTYVEKQASGEVEPNEDPGDVEPEEGSEEVKPNGATVTFNDGAVSSITGIDVAGETVTVNDGKGATTTYGLDKIGIYRVENGKTAYYTGTVVGDDYGKVDVILASKTKTDWIDYKKVDLTKPTIAITPEFGDDTSYYLVTATGSRATVSKLKTGEPTGAQNYFTVAKEGETYKLTYTESAINPIHLKDSVTVTLNGSNITSDSTFELYHPAGADATYTYNVTALKNGAAFANVSSGDTFAATAKGSYSFTMAGGEEAQEAQSYSYSVTAASNFVADESAVAMYSGTATLDAEHSELVASGAKKEDESDNVIVEFTAADNTEDHTATVKVANGEVTSITGLQDGDSVTFADKDKTETYTKTPTGFIRTVGEESAEYTGTITDIITAIKKASEWYALGDVTFEAGVELDLGTVTTNSYYKLTKITEEGATVVKAAKQPTDKENYFTVSESGDVSYHQATSEEGTPKATADASQAKVKFAAQNLDKLTLNGQGAEENGVQNYVVSGVKKGAVVSGVAAGDIIKTASTATVNGFEYDSTAGALEIHGIAVALDSGDVPTPGDPEEPVEPEDVEDTTNSTALYSGTVNVIGDLEKYENNKVLTVGSNTDERTETVTITSDPGVTNTKTGAVVTAKDGVITAIKDLEKGEVIEHKHVVDGSSVLDFYIYNGTSIIKTTYTDGGENTYAYDVAAAKNTDVLKINQWEDVTGGVTAGEKIALTITLPAEIGENGAFYEVTGSKSTNIKVAAKASDTVPEGSNFFRFYESDDENGIYNLVYRPAGDATGNFAIKLGNAKANINATAFTSGTLNLSEGVEGYLPNYNVTGLKAGVNITSDENVGFTLTTAALKKDNEINIDGKTYTAGANGALKFEKDGNSVVFQSGTLKLASTGEAGVTARYVYTDSSREKHDTFATITSTAGEGTDGVLLTATAAGGLTVKDLEKDETVTIKVGEEGSVYTYSINADGKLTRFKDGVTSIYTGAAKFAATADVFAAATNTSKWVETYEVEAFTSVLNLQPTGVNATGKSAATYYEVVLDKDGYESTGKVKVSSIGSAVDTVPTDANYFAVTATGAVTYHSNDYQKADLSGATVIVNYTQALAGAKFTTVARPKDANTANEVGSYEYVANAGMTFTGLTKADSVTANLNNNEKVTVNGTAFTAVGQQMLSVGIIDSEVANKQVAALKSESTILVKGTYYVATSSVDDDSYAKVVSAGNGVDVTFGENNNITSISGFDKNEKIEVYTPNDENTKVDKIATYQVNAAGTMVIWTDSENHQQQAALVDGAIDMSNPIWEDLAFAGSATLTLNDKTADGNYGVDKKFLNSATAAATIIKLGEDKTTVGAVSTMGNDSIFAAANTFEGNVKITTSGTKTWELTGSKGNDTFTLGTATTLHGSKGNDTITSSAKADTFDYTTAGALTGEDMIKSFTSTAKVVDTIKVGGDAEFTLKGAGTNVELTIGDENGKKVSLVGMVGKEIDVAKGENAATAYIVGNDTKANTFTLTNVQLEDTSKNYSLIGGSNAYDTFKVTQNNTNKALELDLSARAKDVDIFTAAGSKGKVKITNGGEFDSITGGNADDTIKAGAITDWISGGKGNDSIDFGDGSRLSKTYQLNAGDGHDTIVNFNATDRIFLGKGAVTKVEEVKEGEEVKAVKITAGSDSVVLEGVTDIKDIKNNLYTSAGKHISDAWYYNSGVLTDATFAGNTITLAKDYHGDEFDLSSIEDFDGWVEANYSTYQSLNITATAVQSALLIKGNDDANIIKAGGKVGEVTTIDGGKGNDTLYGGAGTDVFIFEAGHGQDTVNNFINGKDVVSLTSSANLTHTTTGANVEIYTEGDESNSITLIGKANTRIDILGEGATSVAPASDYTTAYYFGKTTAANTYNVNAKDMLNAHFFGSDEVKDTLTITANGVTFTQTAGNDLIEDEYVKVNLLDSSKFRSIDELNAQAVSKNLHVISGSEVDEDTGNKTTTTIKAGKGNDSIECSDGQDIIYYGGNGFGEDTISGFNATTDKLWVANTIKSVEALDNRVEIIFGSGKNESTLTVMGEGLTAQDLEENQAVIASATAKANAASWTKAYNTYIADLK